MAAAGKLAVKRRIENGSIACRRLRQKGIVPGNIYGHKQDPVPLSASAAEVESLIRAGTRVLDVEVEGHAEKVLFREVQWDYLGKEVVHFDLLRIDPNERLEVEVKVELKGTAPGVLAGGVLDHSLRTLHIECLAIAIPDSIVVKISTLEIDHAIHVRDIEAPENTKVLNNPDTVIVRVAAKVEEPEPTVAVAGEEGPAQPEVIGRKVAEEGEEPEEPAEKKK
jgi:large subunit ribosomal protein L25